MSVLRWILVVPVSFACGVLATMMARVISRYLNRLVLVKMITGFCAGVLCISVAGWLAPSQKKTYSDVQSAFENHEILQSSKSDLEQFLLAIAMTRVLDPANQIRTTEMGDTIRLLLAARQSQQMHSQSSKVSCIALIISVAA